MTVLVALAVSITLALAAVAVTATLEVRARSKALDAAASRLETPTGVTEYASWGTGPSVLVLHGAGGGFDQGRLIAEALGGEGVRWIAPSRFGYLGSTLPPDASTAAQADALARLLDHLEVRRVALLAFSGGVPPALQFAARHPERTVALVLLSSAPFTPFGPDVEDRALPAWMYQLLFGNDVLYWLLTKLSPGMLQAAFDARPQLRESLPASEREFVARLVDAFLPASRRLPGVRNEGAAVAADAVYDLAAIRAPTLVIHARDDRINPFAVGDTIARGVTGAQFVALADGGHLLLGHHAQVRERVTAFLAQAQ